MIKILAACGAGVNSSHQIKSAIENEMKNRGYQVTVDTTMIKDINQDKLERYDSHKLLIQTWDLTLIFL